VGGVAETQKQRWARVAHPHVNTDFDGIPNKRSQRADLHAFMSLDAWLPGRRSDIVSAAEHDTIYLNIDDADLADLADEQLIELARCGVWYDDDGLCMFV
jgi:hypothetical protein